MATFHRTQRLEIYGKKPEVTQLFGSRYRMVVRCQAKNETEGRPILLPYVPFPYGIMYSFVYCFS